MKSIHLPKTFNFTSVLTSVGSSCAAGVIRHLYVLSLSFWAAATVKVVVWESVLKNPGEEVKWVTPLVTSVPSDLVHLTVCSCAVKPVTLHSIVTAFVPVRTSLLTAVTTENIAL